MVRIGLGLAALGRPEYINIRENKDIDKSEIAFKQNAFNVLDWAYKHGVRYFDTAPSYGKGEAFLLAWYQKKKHKDLHFGTKWGYTYKANWQLGFKGNHEIKEHSLSKLKEQWQTSKHLLPALQTYQIHSATFESGVLQNQDVLNQLYIIKKNTGIKIGITTSGPNQKEVITEALKIKINSIDLFDSFQITFNIFEQDTATIIREALKDNKQIIIKEALANGRVFGSNTFGHHKKTQAVLGELANNYKVGVDAIALRFIIDYLNPDIVLSGASNTTHLLQNLDAFNFTLSNGDINKLIQHQINPKTYWNERSELLWN